MTVFSDGSSTAIVLGSGSPSSCNILGGAVVAKIAVVVLYFVWRNFLRPGADYRIYGSKDGYWAVVTGASDGIGKEYAIALAQKGFNVALVGRSVEKLKATAIAIESLTKSKTMLLVIDLAVARENDWQKLSDDLKGLNIGVCVNNAGLSLDYPEKYLEVDPRKLKDIIQVNIVAVHEITYRLLPLLLKNKEKGKRGLLLNISSMSSLFPTPYLAIYGASKSFVSSFSAALAAEYEEKGVDVDCPVPFFVISNMSKRKHATWDCPTAAKFVKASLSKAAHGDWVPFSPYWSHGIIEFLLTHLPVPTKFIIDRSMRMHCAIRSKYLAKMSKTK